MEILESEKTELEAQVASNSIVHSGISFELDDRPWNLQPPPSPSPCRKIFLVASLAIGIQYRWTLQITHLASYIQLLSLSTRWSFFLPLCGPLSGMILQPIIGFYSDHSTSHFGPRRPFIVVGVALTIFAEFLIGFAVDFGYSSYDQAAIPPNFGYFMVGFLTLDVGNNILQNTCRALLGDMASEDHSKTHLGYAAFLFFIGVGNIIGYSTVTLAIMHDNLVTMVYVSKMIEYERDGVAGGGVFVVSIPFRVAKVFGLVVFCVLGISTAVSLSIPYALASIFSVSSHAGQGILVAVVGLSIGVLNLAIVIPQILVIATFGPWGGLYRGGYIRSFAVAAFMATASAILSFTLLPEPS